MKKILYIVLFFLSLSLNATTYYISTSGNDVTGNGSIGNPWRTLYKACDATSVAGDIISVPAGTFVESNTCYLKVGISIEGAGVTSIIRAGASTLIDCDSGSPTNGNQHISGLLLDGNNLTGDYAISVEGRSHVEIYNCTFQNFSTIGVIFGGAGGGWPETQPDDSELSHDNKFHDNIMNNCASYDAAGDNGWGNLCVGMQVNMLVYNNTITQNQRIGDENGYCIKFFNYGWNQGWKIYNNTLTNKPSDGPQPNTSWGFAIETWNSMGGLEIYNNVIKGGVDLCRVYLGTYERGVDLYNNTMGYDDVVPALDTEGEVAVRLEARINGVYIHHNRFKYHAMAVYADIFSASHYEDGVYIYYNIMENIGNDIGGGYGFRYTGETGVGAYTNLGIWNNVIIANPEVGTTYGVTLPSTTTSNVNIRNNIIVGFGSSPVYKSSTGSYSNVNITNNIFYDNGNSDVPVGNYSGLNVTGNITTNPLFTSSSDYHLLEGSDGIDAGIEMTITNLLGDYDNVTVSDPPEIGVYEYGVEPEPDPDPIPVGVESGKMKLNGKWIRSSGKILIVR
jgi:hypothetical protein